MAGCSGEVLDQRYDGGPSVRIAGPVAAEVRFENDPTAAVVWAWSAGGGLGGLESGAALDARFFSYGLDVPPPPSPGAADAAVPEGWAGLLDIDLLIGVPVLLDRPADTPAADVDATGVLDWVRFGDAVPDVPGLAAIPRDHVLIVLDAASPFDRLGEAPAWSGGPCLLDEVVPGLTVYHRDGPECGGWRPVVGPGESLEIQGIEMQAP